MTDSQQHTLSFSLEAVVRLLVVSLGVAGTIWATTSGLRSDVRDVLTTMRAEAEKRELQETLLDERIAGVREMANDHKRRIELLQIQVLEMREMILKQQTVRD